VTGPSAAWLSRWLEIVRLKALPRAGWIRAGVPAPESVAAHSWGVAWLVLELLPAELDLGRALAYAVLHDLPEARVGDITPHDGVAPATKHAREAAAAAALLPPHLAERWAAYEAQADPEARFVRQLDRLDMAVQAVAYAEQADDVRPFLASARRVVVDPRLVAILDILEARLS
jgi:putative hydrolase of HD superfamily